MNEDKNKQLFFSLIYSFQMQTMMQLGKLANPVTGTIEKELDGAQVTIDMLDMLKAKTKGNNSEDENRFLDQVIADLKLNYVEERDIETKASQSTGTIEDSKPEAETAEISEDAEEEKPDEGKK
ncbi:MAG TPA: DUF1844 domain-containing protein [Ignavibacteria bacterium]|nr:DUF1844 domain-containing protein [Ignavibacteria bacterium]